MPQVLEGVITSEQRETFEITNFIFHIIQLDQAGDAELIYLDEVELHPKQKTFFVERLKEIAEGTQYLFRQDAVHLREKCEQIITSPDRFIEFSKQIAADFGSRHNRSMSPGVFVVAVVRYLVSPHNWQNMIFLVKMDGQPSFTYSYEKIGIKTVAVVNEVPNSLNEDKKAIQKWALIDISGSHLWQVLAYDKVNKNLGDYFRGFLGVIERQQDSVLTKLAHVTVRKWAKKIAANDLPENEDIHTYSARAFNYLNDNDTFNTESFINTVVRDQDSTRKIQFMALLKKDLEDAGIAGQIFTPRPDSIPKGQKKSVYVTYEGVKLEWEGDRESVGIAFTTLSNGNTRITIETSKVAPKG